MALRNNFTVSKGKKFYLNDAINNMNNNKRGNE